MALLKSTNFYIYFCSYAICKYQASRNKWDLFPELLVIFGVYEFKSSLGYISALTVIIGASYMLWMFQRAILQNRPEGSAQT